MNEDMPEKYANSPPAFSAPVYNERGAPVVEVYGEVDLSTTSELLEAIGRAGSRMDGLPIAFVDLRNADFIDVYGVRNLVEQAVGMRQLGGELRLVVPEEGPVARVFELLGIEQVLDLHHELDLSTYDSAS